MCRYTFKDLTSTQRLIDTMVDQSKMTPEAAADVIFNRLKRCVEVWEGDMLCGYFLIMEKDGVRQLHGYNLTKGRARHALRIALHLLKTEPKVYSGHGEANNQVNRLLKIMGFKERSTINGVKMMERVCA